MANPNPTTGNTYSITVPPQSGSLPRREEVLEPLARILLDAAETLHGHSGTDWIAERCTERERDHMLLAARYVNGLMIVLGLWDRDTLR